MLYDATQTTLNRGRRTLDHQTDIASKLTNHTRTVEKMV